MAAREAWPHPRGERSHGQVWLRDTSAASSSKRPSTQALAFALGAPPHRRPRRAQRFALTMVVLGLMGFAAGVGTWGMFTDSAPVTDNTFGSGTVTIGDDDGGSSPMFSLTGLQPSSTDSGCIVVTYSGSVTANVRLYGSTAGTGLDQYLDLTVTRGTKSGAFDSCSGFTADSTNYIGQGAGVIYGGTLQGFPDDYNAGTVDPTSGSPEAWTSGEAHAYRFAVTLQNNVAAQGKNATQTFTWEARNV